MIGMLPPVSKSAYSSHNEKIAAATSLEHEAQFSAAAALLSTTTKLVSDFPKNGYFSFVQNISSNILYTILKLFLCERLVFFCRTTNQKLCNRV